jgi:hypothetical protein
MEFRFLLEVIIRLSPIRFAWTVANYPDSLACRLRIHPATMVQILGATACFRRHVSRIVREWNAWKKRETPLGNQGGLF